MLKTDNKELSLSTQAELLSLNRTSLYYKPVEPSDEEIAIKHRIDEVYTKHPYFGYRRITAELNRAGMNVNHKRIQRYMQEMGIKGICHGPNLSKRNIADATYPYLLNGLVIDHPDHVWSIDITYIRLKHSWMYLTAVMDQFSRYVLSWELSQTLEMPFVLEAVKEALLIGKPDIFNSDQGSHFTSPQYTQMLLDNGIKISMDSKGRALDNIFIERLWRSLKYEEVYINDYETPRDARNGISKYLGFYNSERPHQSLRYLTPAEVYYRAHDKAGVWSTGVVALPLQGRPKG
jgi:putative transposase